MRRRRTFGAVIFVIYILIGVVVAAGNDYSRISTT
jgi:hypothetical protein